MYLVKKEKKDNRTEIQLEIYKFTDDLVMVSVDNDTSDPGVPSYWRLLDKQVDPPLEVGVNETSGTIRSITLFANKDYFEEFEIKSDNISKGNIVVDLELFRKRYDFIDIEDNYFVSLSGKKFICRFGEKCDVKESIVNGDIEFYIDYHEQLVGFSINILNESELETISSVIIG
jgi:hypothetical protein